MNRLKQLRKKNQLTQVTAARLCGVSRRKYQMYEESGEECKPYNELLAKLEAMGFNGKLPMILNAKLIKSLTNEVFAKHKEVKCAYLFGSYARNEATAKSDVDILIVAPDLKGFEFSGLHHELRTTLGKDVDLVSHTTLLHSEKMLRDVLVEGVNIYGQRINLLADRRNR